MKNTIATTTLIINSICLANAQGVAIGNTQFSPVPSALLELRSSEKGVLLPRLNLQEMMSIASPADGLIVYCTTGNEGFYWYANGDWKPISDGMGNHHAYAELAMNDHFVSGDGDAEGLMVDSIGRVGIGTGDPRTTLDLNGSIALRTDSIMISPGWNGVLTAPLSSVMVILGPVTDFEIKEIACGADGQLLTLINPTQFNMSLVNESQTVQGINRIMTLNGGFTSLGSCAVSLIYVGSLQRWVVVNSRR